MTDSTDNVRKTESSDTSSNNTDSRTLSWLRHQLSNLTTEDPGISWFTTTQIDSFSAYNPVTLALLQKFPLVVKEHLDQGADPERVQNEVQQIREAVTEVESWFRAGGVEFKEVLEDDELMGLARRLSESVRRKLEEAVAASLKRENAGDDEEEVVL